MLRARGLVLLALAFSAVGSIEATAELPPMPPARPPEFAAPANSPEARPVQGPPSPLAPAVPKENGAATCLAKLIAGGASAEAEPSPATSVDGCGIDVPVRLSSIAVDGEAVSLQDRPLVSCEFALTLADYVRVIVAPLGQAMLHARITGIETGPGYACRTQDRIAGAKISAHAKGLAVDFTTIMFADKRRVAIERQAGAEETAYLHAVRRAACGWFTTVLGPGSDAFHANNMHLDTEEHGSSGSFRICQ
jgi:hypothetical protein